MAGKTGIDSLTKTMQDYANHNSAPIIVAPTALHDNQAGYVIIGSKHKIKSGKFANHNVNLIKEEV